MTAFVQLADGIKPLYGQWTSTGIISPFPCTPLTERDAGFVTGGLCAIADIAISRYKTTVNRDPVIATKIFIGDQHPHTDHIVYKYCADYTCTWYFHL